VAGAKRRKRKAGSGWSWRLAGVALCAFFVLGVITGLSQSGRLLAHRIEALLERLPHSSRSELIPAAYQALFNEPPVHAVVRPLTPLGARSAAAIALVEYTNGFFEVDGQGDLQGPVSPADSADLPVLSGLGVEHAQASQLVEYAGQLIRAEAMLSAIVSEMRVTSSGEIHLFLERPHLMIALAPAELPLQLARAAQVLAVWRQHRDLVAMIDMTIAGEAIVQPRADALERPDGNGGKSTSRPG
jgi:hypothetical protein